MRTMRILLALSISSIFAIAAACGGDDSNAGSADGGSGDGSTSDATAGDGGSDASVPPDAKANDLDVYVQQTATLDATASTPSSATFSWQLASAPAGSNVTTASIANATTATPSFVPDVLGTYVLTLNVTSGGASSTKNVNVRAFTGKAFLSHFVPVDAGSQSDVVFAPTFGGDGGTSTVSCETLYKQTFTSTAGTIPAAPFAEQTLPGSIDWREGPPASEAIVAFGFRETAPDGGYTNYLATGTSSSQCGTLLKLDALVNAGDVPMGVRISPNADRAAFIRQNGSSIDVATIGLDGSNLRVLGSVYRATDGGAGTLPTTTGYSFLKRRVQWIDETHVAWIGIDTDVPGAFNVLTATDSTSPNITDYMDCTAAVATATSVNEPDILEFAMLGDGNVLVSGEVSTVDAGTQGIYVLRPNPVSKQCELEGQIGVQAQNFAISPEGSRVAFTGLNTDAGTNEMFVGPLDGGAPSLVRSNDAGLSFSSGYGPQWVQGGAALLYTEVPAILDGGSQNNAVVVPATGGAVLPVAYSESAGNAYFVPTNDAACSIGFAGSATPLAGVFLSLGLLVARRRRKHAKPD